MASPWLSPSGQVNFLVLWFHNDPGLSAKVWRIRLGHTCAYIGHRIPVLPQIEVLGNIPGLPKSLQPLLLTHTSSVPPPLSEERCCLLVPGHFSSGRWGQGNSPILVSHQLDWTCLLMYIINYLPEGLSVVCMCWVGRLNPSLPGLAGGLGAVFAIPVDVDE